MNEHTLYLAGGCYWGVEHALKLVRGVLHTQVGFANGRTQNPTYEAVCHNDTGHAETVRVTYDADVLPLSLLLHFFFKIIDPSSINAQGGDVGTQYRTGVYYTDENDVPIIEEAFAKLKNELRKPIAVACERLQNFYPAHEAHQDYLTKNPHGYCHISPAHFALARSINAEKTLPDDVRHRLTPEAYAVTQLGATEAPFTNAYANEFRRGIYVDRVSGAVLFVSADKFESGCGWPSFSKPFTPDAVVEQPDLSYNRVRTEIKGRASNSHLGHVFDDGPKERGGLRYCMNSAALRFIPEAEMAAEGYGDYLRYLD